MAFALLIIANSLRFYLKCKFSRSNLRKFAHQQRIANYFSLRNGLFFRKMNVLINFFILSK